MKLIGRSEDGESRFIVTMSRDEWNAWCSLTPAPDRTLDVSIVEAFQQFKWALTEGAKAMGLQVVPMETLPANPEVT